MFPQSFPVCPPAETLLRKWNLLPGKQKCFQSNSETFHVSQAWFLLRKHCFLVFAHLGKHGETLAGNNVSATMFPSLPKALLQWIKLSCSPIVRSGQRNNLTYPVLLLFQSSLQGEENMISLHGESRADNPAYQGPAFPPRNIPMDVQDHDGFQGTLGDLRTPSETVEHKARELYALWFVTLFFFRALPFSLLNPPS